MVNGCTDQSSVDRLLGRIRSARDAPNKTDLHVERLQELLVSPGESANLGVYRIVLEGGVALDARYADEVVTVTASRRVYGWRRHRRADHRDCRATQLHVSRLSAG
ncbi:hypothetical protein WME76_13005 [Sorangium sp. So ce119]|uniref:hypothetical protein n=1 Tax=Sorangium sp. So ce119 TaxID=3133279 RepID=UPI003F60FBBE